MVNSYCRSCLYLYCLGACLSVRPYLPNYTKRRRTKKRMIIAIIIILAILWLLGYAPLAGISIPNITLFTINSHAVTLWEILILVVIGWAIGILPRPLQAAASVLLVLWI